MGVMGEWERVGEWGGVWVGVVRGLQVAWVGSLRASRCAFCCASPVLLFVASL